MILYKFSMQAETQQVKTPLWQLFASFFKIGAFTFGGGWAMISIIEREIVDKYHWIERDDFLDLLAVAQSLPGILAVNIATAVGDKLRGTRGSIIASAGTILPSFLIILAIAIFLTPDMIKNNRVISSIFMGMRPAVVALIIAPVLTSAKAAKIGLKTVWIPLVVALMISSISDSFPTRSYIFCSGASVASFSGGYPANTALKPYSAPYSPIHPHNPIYPKKHANLPQTHMGLHKDRHLRIRRRLRHAFACGESRCRSRLDIRDYVHRYCRHITDDSRTDRYQFRHLYRLRRSGSRKPGIQWYRMGAYRIHTCHTCSNCAELLSGALQRAFHTPT